MEDSTWRTTLALGLAVSNWISAWTLPDLRKSNIVSSMRSLFWLVTKPIFLLHTKDFGKVRPKQCLQSTRQICIITHASSYMFSRACHSLHIFSAHLTFWMVYVTRHRFSNWLTSKTRNSLTISNLQLLTNIFLTILSLSINSYKKKIVYGGSVNYLVPEREHCGVLIPWMLLIQGWNLRKESKIWSSCSKYR